MAFRNTVQALVIVGAPGSPQVIIDPSQSGTIQFLNPADTAPNPATIGRDPFGANNSVDIVSPYFGAANSFDGAAFGTFVGNAAGGLITFSTQNAAGANSVQLSIDGNTSFGINPQIVGSTPSGQGTIPIELTGIGRQVYLQGGQVNLGNSNASGQYTLNYPQAFPIATIGIGATVVATTSSLNTGIQFYSPITRFGATITIRNSSTGANPGAGIGLVIAYVAIGQ